MDETVDVPPQEVDNYQINIVSPNPVPTVLGTDDLQFSVYLFNGENQTDKKISVETVLTETNNPNPLNCLFGKTNGIIVIAIKNRLMKLKEELTNGI